jgi:hypothetical protein
MGVCREAICMGGRHRIRRCRGLGGRWEVIPGTGQFTPPLTRRSPWRVAKWHLRKGEMMTLGPRMGAARH